MPNSPIYITIQTDWKAIGLALIFSSSILGGCLMLIIGRLAHAIEIAIPRVFRTEHVQTVVIRPEPEINAQVPKENLQ